MHYGAKSGNLSTRAFLRAVERRAKRMRRRLQRRELRRRPGKRVSGFMDALRLVGLIERLAHRGQKVRAAEAIRIVEYIGRLIDALRREL
jgi:hypothetical protein